MYFREQTGNSFRALAPSDVAQAFIQGHLQVWSEEVVYVLPGRSCSKAESFAPMHLNAGAGRTE